MSFISDKQTLDDLNLTGKYKPYSIIGLFNKVQTRGGERLLEHMFQEPLTDAVAINRRSGLFQYFEQKAVLFPFTKEELSVMEDYLGGGGSGTMVSAGMGALRKKVSGVLLRSPAYDELCGAIGTVIGVLRGLKGLLDKIGDPPSLPEVTEMRRILEGRRLARLDAGSAWPRVAVERSSAAAWPTDPLGSVGSQPSLILVARYDHLFLSVLHGELEQLLQGIYQLDVYIAVSQVARARGFSYAKALPRESQVLRAAALRHPGIEKAVANPVTLNGDSNMLFLTGANMAGKSTFMKAFGIAVYMAHMGFPVAASEMVFSVREGLYTSINVPDNLSLGYSHFYAEVLRVKKVAGEVSGGKDLVVIFDELFKGTNVKDAYDATLAVTEAFAAYRNCCFIISTHITEVGETLRDRCDNLQFVYLPTVMDGQLPRYTYKMEKGITADRHGMLIIENERILEIIKSVTI
jgi:DNA mismatch repair protein MutS